MIHREYIWLYDVFSSTSRPQITASPSLQGWNVVTLNIKKKKKYLIIVHVTLLSDLFSALFWCCHHESYKMSFVLLSLVSFSFLPTEYLPFSRFVSLFVKIPWTFNILYIIFFLTCYQYCFNQETVETIGLLNDSECFCGGAQCNKLFLKAFHLPVSNPTDHGWVS